MKKLSEIDKLKYWLDIEITILHIMFAVVIWLLTHGGFMHFLLAVYMFISVIYIGTRAVYLASVDRNYLKVPKQ